MAARGCHFYTLARPEGFEPPTPWFVGSLKISGYFVIQQLKWPALDDCFVKSRRVSPKPYVIDCMAAVGPTSVGDEAEILTP